jgi:energy-coupling factor transport system ATP-binding protein
MPLVEIDKLSFSYPGAAYLALDGVSLELERGEFVLLCGRSGCGKTTLLRQLKTALTPQGECAGELRFDGRPLAEVTQREQAERIGFVLQSPDNQIVTDKVWHELAFGLESLGTPQQAIRLRVAEMASFFGIQEWYHKKVTELSGGQKQLLNLAAVMAMQPDLLVLDEPTSQLDPIAASEFLAAVKKVNGDLGVTVLLSEHRLEEAMTLCDRTIVMDKGRVISEGTPAEVGSALAKRGHPMLAAMSTALRVALAVGESTGELPVTVRDGRTWLASVIADGDRGADCEHRLPRDGCAVARNDGLAGLPGHRASHNDAKETTTPVVISARDVWFRYERNGTDVLRGLTLNVYVGELFCIVGGNGTGKTTALGVLSGALKSYRGKTCVGGLDPRKASRADLFAAGLAALPQDPQTLFLHNTILEDLAAAAPSGPGRDERLTRVIEQTEIEGILSQHPYDVSGGEQQRAALAMALLTEPSLLLLDEPTKGMDAFYKRRFAAILARLRADGLTVVMVSHDVEFCAEYASRCALFFDGGVVASAEPRDFFSSNSFYTTAANRMARGLVEGAVTAEDLIGALSC